METKVWTLSDFLLARFGEEEAVALACQERSWEPTIEATGDWHTGQAFDMGRIDGVFVDSEDPKGLVGTPEHVTHAARHDPACVLADVAAKRRIVEYSQQLEADSMEGGYSDGTSGRAALVVVLRALAQPYASHPDYPGM